MLAGGLPVGTTHERSQRLQCKQGLALRIHAQPEPHQGQMAIAGRIREPLGRKPGALHPKALAVYFHAEPSRLLPWVQQGVGRAGNDGTHWGWKCGTRRHGSNPPGGKGACNHPILPLGMALRAFLPLRWIAGTVMWMASTPFPAADVKRGAETCLALVGKDC